MQVDQNAFRQMDPAVQAAIRQTEEDADDQYFAQETPDAICQAVKGIERVSHIVRAMKDFSHPGTAYKVLLTARRRISEVLGGETAQLRGSSRCQRANLCAMRAVAYFRPSGSSS